ncbi:MAG: HDOD domain-containing protein [Calditerrivibrio sp.]|nr:HDOD domain-containing protein [Calditerrivibrio sp.]
MENFYVGRQPILDKNGSIFAYELLFRDSGSNVANFKDAKYAISKTIVNLIDKFGIEQILGRAQGFLNVNEDFIFNEFIESMDKKRFVFEILENCKINNELVKRIEELKNKGYRFALDDLVFTEEYMSNFKPLLNIVDIIKVDIRDNTKYELIKKTRMIKNPKIKLLAEKVETYDEFIFTRDLGYELFQGYYFEKPTILIKEGYSSNRTVIFKIISGINKNEKTQTIASYFEMDPNLTMSLLKFINSAAFYFRQRINSIVQAINLIGIVKLQNWLLMMSYAEGESPSTSPLFQTSILRGKILEYILEKIANDKQLIDKGFLTGILSLSDVIYKTKLENIVKELNLDNDITSAILNREGILGNILTLIEYDEKNKIEAFIDKMIELKISEELFNDAKLSSIIWLNTLLKSL